MAALRGRPHRRLEYTTMATRKSLSSVVAEPEPDIIIPDYRNVEVSGEKVTEYQVTYHHESGDQTTWHR